MWVSADTGPRGGSSPLARGLRWKAAAAKTEGGIIPARAGFTRDPQEGGPGREDHPRSRGVYFPTPPGWEPSAGSSPLARGLHDDDAARLAAFGIIPARAGFTRPPSRPGCRSTDHPRSRGVYQPRPGREDRRGGSSPLARGLRPRRQRVERGDRIIPARAGFTPAHVLRHAYHVDHPRSRGVYWFRGSSFGSFRGSSPLARGLHAAMSTVPPESRIIPARAGFTGAPRRRIPRFWDHPRSRGVYTTRTSPPRPTAGSSPLARGLPRRADPRGAGPGIIPARAGFTPGHV